MPPKPSSSPPKNFTSLPPDLIIKVFTYLPVADLPSVALTSRRFKILVYNDAVYEPKLKFLGIDENGAGGGGRSSLEDGQVEGGEAAEASGEKSFMSSSSPSQTEKREMDLLSTRLKQLPGGHLLPINTTYLQTGAFFSDAVAEEAGAASEPASATEPAGAPLSPQINEAGVPDFKTITIGAGGLKAIKSKLKAAIGGGVGKKAANTGKSSNRFNQQPSNSTMERAARETFRQLFVELKPYFMDFRDRQRDSKLFKDYKDLEDIAYIE